MELRCLGAVWQVCWRIALQCFSGIIRPGCLSSRNEEAIGYRLLALWIWWRISIGLWAHTQFMPQVFLLLVGCTLSPCSVLTLGTRCSGFNQQSSSSINTVVLPRVDRLVPHKTSEHITPLNKNKY